MIPISTTTAAISTNVKPRLFWVVSFLGFNSIPFDRNHIISLDSSQEKAVVLDSCNHPEIGEDI
jgi:hypothetical protein